MSVFKLPNVSYVLCVFFKSYYFNVSQKLQMM